MLLDAVVQTLHPLVQNALHSLGALARSLEEWREGLDVADTGPWIRWVAFVALHFGRVPQLVLWVMRARVHLRRQLGHGGLGRSMRAALVALLYGRSPRVTEGGW